MFSRILLVIFSFLFPFYCFSSLNDETKARKSVENFARNVSKKYNLKFLSSGCGTIVDSTDVIWDLNFVTHRPLTLEQARDLTVNIGNGLIQWLYTEKAAQIHLKDLKTIFNDFDPTPMPLRIGFKIAFWDENVNRPLFPHLAQVKVFEGKIHYFYANPKDQSLQPPIIETFEEAFAKVGKSFKS